MGGSLTIFYVRKIAQLDLNVACIDATGIPASQRWGVQCGEVGMKLPEVPAAAFGQSKEPAGITHGRLDSQHTGFLRFALSPHLPGQLWIRDWATRDWAGLAEAAVECRCHTLVTPWPRHPETGWKLRVPLAPPSRVQWYSGWGILCPSAPVLGGILKHSHILIQTEA